MTTFRRVPYGAAPGAQGYNAAHAYALMESGSEAVAVKFASWYVDTRIGMEFPEAWERAPKWMKKSR